jgi:hypothetical protein
MALFYVKSFLPARPVDWVLAVGAIIAVAVGGHGRDVLTVPAEKDAYWFGQASEHCLLTD